MKINGIEFEDPRVSPPRKKDIREYKDGARTTVKEMWVEGYVMDGQAYCLQRYPMTITNRGVCTFDGRQVKDEEEKSLVAKLFESVVPV